MSLLILGLLLATTPVLSADLKPETVKAFNAYMADADAQMQARATGAKPFLWSASNDARWKQLKAEGVLVSPTFESPSHDVESGLVHDWTGAIFIPGAKVEQALRILQDVDDHKRIYAPDTVDSRMISRNGNEFRSSMRTYKKKVLTSVLDYEFHTVYTQLAPGRWRGRIRSTRIVEVEDYKTPQERQKPEGTGMGFLWRLNSWWHVEERDGGVVMELRSISLTRDIPFGLSWAIKPTVTSLPRETLESNLGKTRAAVMALSNQGAAR